MIALPPCGLYAITDSALLSGERFLATVEQAIMGGTAMIQYRDKGTDTVLREHQARALTELCHDRDVPLIVNDDVRLAKDVGADGVHLGRNDTSLTDARKTLGENAIIGVSCYNEPERALRAQTDGASYVAFGRFYPSSTKPLAVQATPEMLRRIASRLSLPVVVIGGIKPENGASLVDAGADFLAVVSGVFGVPEPRAAAARFARLFHTANPGTRGESESQAV